MAFSMKSVVVLQPVVDARAAPRPAKSLRPVPRAAAGAEPARVAAPARVASRRETLLSATTLPALAALFGPFPGDTPTDLGVQASGGLKGCPETPNCLSSSAPAGDSHFTPALSYDKSDKAAIADVASIIQSYPLDLGFDGGGAVITKQSDGYLYGNFTSKLFGFVDDVEFLCKDGKMAIRSASRIGESDGGVNTKRVAFFTAELKKKGGWA